MFLTFIPLHTGNSVNLLHLFLCDDKPLSLISPNPEPDGGAT